jgi:hypothetical protein
MGKPEPQRTEPWEPVQREPQEPNMLHPAGSKYNGYVTARSEATVDSWLNEVNARLTPLLACRRASLSLACMVLCCDGVLKQLQWPPSCPCMGFMN